MAARFDECVDFINSARESNGICVCICVYMYMHIYVRISDSASKAKHPPPPRFCHIALTLCSPSVSAPSTLPLYQITTHPTPSVPHMAGRVLVHCRAGVSRSATVVVGYLMAQVSSPHPPTSTHPHDSPAHTPALALADPSVALAPAPSSYPLTTARLPTCPPPDRLAQACPPAT
jgi:hypothetical protein